MRPLKADPAKDPTLELEQQFLVQEKVAAVIGVDEAGRGALAGPVSVGVHVVLKEHQTFPTGLRDSKLLSEKRRESLLPNIEAWGHGAVGFGSAAEIDAHGITKMLAIAARRALLELHGAGVDVQSSVILLDGSHDWLSPALRAPLRVETRVGADRSHASVAAASLRAKVHRDRLMVEAAKKSEFAHYEWHSNKGYGSAAHLAAITEHGPCEMHRQTWIK